MTWEHLIIDILEAFPRVSDIILSENNDYCVLANGAAHKLKLPDCLSDSWPDLMALLFPNHRTVDDDPFHCDTHTVEGAVTLAGSRFRLSALKHSHGHSVVMRLLPFLIPSPEEIDLYPSVVERFKKLDHGLVLLIGPTGSGKSTTIASLIQARMEEIPENIITIEDPIEYVYKQDSISNIFQREVGRLRFIKLLADYNPENVCDALAGTLQLAVAQTLIYNSEIKRRVSLHEVMFMTNAIQAHIRAQKFERIPNELIIGSRRGQISWERSVGERIAQNLLPANFQIGNRLAG